MIVGKGNLQVLHVAGKDKDVESLDNMHICEDGSTVGCAGNIVFAMSPVRLQVKEKLKQLTETPLRKGVTLGIDFVKKLIKNMPRDSMFKGILEHCDIEDMGGPNVKATFHDGQSPFSIKGKKYKGTYAPFKKILQRILGNKDVNSKKIIINRSRLILLLEAFAKTGSVGDQDIVFLEFTKGDDIILRGVNEKTGQRLLATMKTYKYQENKWLKHERWEKKLQDGGDKKYIYRRRT